MEYWPRFSPQELQKFAIIKYGGKGSSYQGDFGALIRRGILAQIFATGAALSNMVAGKGSIYQREAWVLGTSFLISPRLYGGGG